MKPHFWIALLGLASCQVSGTQSGSLSTEAISAPIPELTSEARAEIAICLRAQGIPFRLRPHGTVWRSSDVEVETQYGIELSKKDVQELIALARQSGVAKPRKIWAGNMLGGGGHLTRVVISGEPVLDFVTRMHRTQFLQAACIQWIGMDGERFPTTGGGPWKLDRREDEDENPLWTEDRRYFREGLDLWTYRASDAVPEAVVLDIFSSLASRSLRWPPSERGQPRIELDHHLGRVLTRAEVLDQAAFLVEDWINEDWEYFVQVSLGRWAAASFAVHRDEQGWRVVGVYYAQA